MSLKQYALCSEQCSVVVVVVVAAKVMVARIQSCIHAYVHTCMRVPFCKL